MAVLELNHIVIYFPFSFLTPCVCFFYHSIRHGKPCEAVALHNTPRNQTKKLDRTIEITSGTESNFWVGEWGDSIAGVGFIMDLGIISKFNAAMLFPTQLGSYHDGLGGEFLGNPFFTGNAFIQRMQKYIRLIKIVLCRQLNGKSLATARHISFFVRMQRSISATCSFAAELLTTVFPINSS